MILSLSTVMSPEQFFASFSIEISFSSQEIDPFSFSFDDIFF
jgi:hypothetical protein